MTRAALMCALAIALLATLGTAPAAPAALTSRASGSPDVAKAIRFLRGKRFSTHQSSGGGILDTLSTIDRYYDFCAGVRFR